MKKILIALVVLLVMGVTTQAQTNWTVPIVVTSTVPVTVVQTNEVVAAFLTIQNVVIAVLPDGKVRVMVAWAWKRADGKIVKRGNSNYTEEQIDPLLQAKGLSVAAMRQMFLGIAQAEAMK